MAPNRPTWPFCSRNLVLHFYTATGWARWCVAPSSRDRLWCRMHVASLSLSLSLSASPSPAYSQLSSLAYAVRKEFSAPPPRAQLEGKFPSKIGEWQIELHGFTDHDASEGGGRGRGKGKRDQRYVATLPRAAAAGQFGPW